MIKDNLEYAETYYGISDNLKNGFEWLKSQDLENLEPRKYIIDGKILYANLQEYKTKKDAKYEAHKKYIDIQYMIKGEERVGVNDIKNCKTAIPYDKEADIEFLDCEKKDEYLILNRGEFLILFPNDAHKPSINPENKPNNIVKKIVVKVAID